MKLESFQTAESKHLWKIVRRDDCTDVPGEIISADEDSGECCVNVPNAEGVMEAKALHFGPQGIRLVGRKR